MKKSVLLKFLEVGDERAHYDWDTQAHSHIRCIRCNKVEDMMGIDLKAIKTIADQGSEYQSQVNILPSKVFALSVQKRKSLIDNPCC